MNHVNFCRVSFTLQKKGGDYVFTLLTCKEFYNYSPRSAGLSCNFLWDTPPKINIEPENDGLEDDVPFPGVYLQVPAVNLPGV